MIVPGIGVPNPRASLRFFGLAAACFAVLGLALPAVAGQIETFRHNPMLLVSVHALTLGLTALEMGAFYQLVPVLLQEPPANRRQAAMQPLVLAAGTLLILGGFRWWQPALLVAGGLLVTLAAAWFVLLIAPGILRSLRQGLTAALMAGSVLSLLVVVLLGLTLALNLRLNFLPGGAGTSLGAHLALGAGGWFGLAIAGVSYRLSEMFYLTPRREPPAWASGLAWVTVAALAAAATALLLGLAPVIRPLVALLAVVGLIYALDIGRRLLRRGRRPVDATLAHLFAAITALVLSCLGLLAYAAGWQPSAGGWVGLAILLLPGWVGNMVIGLAYKVIPFLVWYQRFAPLVGKQRIPTLAELLPRYLPQAETALWNAGLAGLLLAALAGGGPEWKLVAGIAIGMGALLFGTNALYVLLRR